jgi:hypothetical protein
MPSSKARKTLSLLAAIPQRPREFYDRVTAVLDVRLEAHRNGRPHYQPFDWDSVVAGLNRSLESSVEECLAERALMEIERAVEQGIAEMPPDAPFAAFHNGDFHLGRLCYALARIRQPRTVVETGVCYGVTSAFLLKALEVNGAGTLHSIDLPPLGKDADGFVGRLVPESLRSNWRLHRGSSRAVLPGILRRADCVDFFVHDSLHTYRNMRWELNAVAPLLSPRAVVIADDVEGNAAFGEWIAEVRPAYSAVLQEQAKRQSLLGVAVTES